MPKYLISSKRFRCTHLVSGKVCGHYSSNYTNSNNHKRVHTKEKPFSCDFPTCGSRFATKGNMIDHRRRHERDKPYKCPVHDCAKAYYRHNLLLDHGRSTFHGELEYGSFLKLLKEARMPVSKSLQEGPEILADINLR